MDELHQLDQVTGERDLAHGGIVLLEGPWLMDQIKFQQHLSGIVGFCGREHLKALLRLASAGIIRVRTPVRDAHERIVSRSQRKIVG